MKELAKNSRIAIQKSGRLNARSIEYVNQFPFMEIIFVRDDDIPYLVQSGACDFGIVGENVLQESGINLPVLESLTFGHCRLSFAVPENFSYQSIRDLNGCRIASSYPKLLRQFALKNKLDITIVVLNGSVEIAPQLGIADAICDLVATGKTLITHGLKEVDVVINSQAVLIGVLKNDQ